MCQTLTENYKIILKNEKKCCIKRKETIFLEMILERHLVIVHWAEFNILGLYYWSYTIALEN